MSLADAIAALPRRRPGVFAAHKRTSGVRAALLCGLRAWKAHAQRSFAGWARGRCVRGALFAAAVASFALGLQVLAAAPAGAQEELPEVEFYFTSLAPEPGRLTEGSEVTLNLWARLDERLRTPLTINLRIGNSEPLGERQATPGRNNDYLLNGMSHTIPFTITIPEEEIQGDSGFFTVRAIEDNEQEGDETIEIQPVDPIGRYTLSQELGSFDIIISDNDLVEWSISPSGPINETSPDNKVITVRRALRAEGEIQVHWQPDGISYSGHPAIPCGIGTPHCDYTVLTSSPLIISAGDPSGRIEIDIEDDNLLEGREGMNDRLRLSRIIVDGTTHFTSESLLGNHYGNVINDNERVTFSITGPPGGLVQEGENADFTVTMELDEGVEIGRPVSIVYNVVEENATAEKDFSIPRTRYVVFRAPASDGATEKFSIPVMEDGLPEPEERFKVVLVSQRGSSHYDVIDIRTPSEATATIAASDQHVVSFNLDTTEVYEGQREEITITATVDEPVSEPLRIEFEIGAISGAGDLATPGTDYNYGGATITPGAEIDNRTVDLTIMTDQFTGMAAFTIVAFDDDAAETDEIIEVGLADAAAGATEGKDLSYVLQTDHPETLDITIKDSLRATVTASPPEVDEGEGVVFTVELSREVEAGETVVVEWEVDNTDVVHPVKANDYTLTGSSSLSITSGTTGTIRVSIIDDLRLEGPETLKLSLTGISVNGETYDRFVPDSAEVVITDNERVTFSIDAPPSGDVPEDIGDGGEGDIEGVNVSTFPVRLELAPGVTREIPVRVFYTVTGGPATEDVGAATVDDFYSHGAIVEFGVGDLETPVIPIRVQDDDHSELEEAFTVMLLLPGPSSGHGWEVVDISMDKGSATANIRRSDQLSVSITGPELSVEEGDPAVFPITIEGGTRQEEMTINFVINYSSPVTLEDFVERFQPGQMIPVTIQPNQAPPSVRIATREDNRVEGDETFSLNISDIETDSMWYTTSDGGTRDAVIRDDDTEPTGITLSVEEPSSGTIPETAGPTPVTIRATPTGPGSPRFSMEEVITLAPFDWEGDREPDERYEFTQLTDDETDCLPLDHESSVSAPDTITIGAGEPYGEVSFCLDPDDGSTADLDRVLIIDANTAYKNRRGEDYIDPARLTILDEDERPTGIRYRVAPGRERVREIVVTTTPIPTTPPTLVTAELMCGEDVCGADDPTLPFDVLLQFGAAHGPSPRFGDPSAGGLDYTSGPTNLPITIRAGDHSGKCFNLGGTLIPCNVVLTPLPDTIVEDDETVAYAADNGGTLYFDANGNKMMQPEGAAFMLEQEILYITIEDDPPDITLMLSENEIEEGYMEHGRLGDNITITASFPAGTTFDTDDDVTINIQARSPRNPLPDSGGLDYALDASIRGRDWWVCGVDMVNADGGVDQVTGITNPLTIQASAGTPSGDLRFCFQALDDLLYEGDEIVTFSAISDSGANLDASGRFTVGIDRLTIRDTTTRPTGPIALSVHSPDLAEVNEGDTAGVPVTVEARFPPGSTVLPAPLVLDVMLEQGDADGEARYRGAGDGGAADYVRVSPFTITIPAGHRGTRSSSPFDLRPMDDDVVEGNETIPITGEVQMAGYTGITFTGPEPPLTLVDNDDPPRIIALRLTEVIGQAPLVTGRMGPRLSFNEVPGVEAAGTNVYLLSAHFVDGGVLNRDVTLNNVHWFDPSLIGDSGLIDPLVIRQGTRDSNFIDSPVPRGSNNDYAGDWIVTFRLPDGALPPTGFTAVQPAYLRYIDNDREIRLTTVNPAGVPVLEDAGVAPVTVHADIQDATGTKSFLATPIWVPIEFRPYFRRSAQSPADYIVTLPVDGGCPDTTPRTSSVPGLGITIEPGRTDGQATFCFRPVADEDDGEGTEFVDIRWQRSEGIPFGSVYEDAVSGVRYDTYYTDMDDTNNSARVRIFDPVIATVHRPEGVFSHFENEGPAEFEVRLNRTVTFPVLVTWAVDGSSSVDENEDYEAPTSTSLTIPPRSTSETFSITLLDDHVLEGTESLVVRLTSALGGPGAGIQAARVGDSPYNSARLLIQDNDIPHVRVRGDRVEESDGEAEITLTLEYPTDDEVVREVPVDVAWATRPVRGSAIPGDSCDTPGVEVDYVSVPRRVVEFPVGDYEVTDTITICDDEILEDLEETLLVALSPESPLAEPDGRGLVNVTIVDDDYDRPEITLVVTTGDTRSSVWEDVIPDVQAVTVRASFDPDAILPPLPVDITLDLRDVTATLGEDYSFVAADIPTLTIRSDRRARSSSVIFDITINDDTFIEGNETIEVHGEAEGYTIAHDTLEILDDERPHNFIDLIVDPQVIHEGSGLAVVMLTAILREGLGGPLMDLTIPLECFDIYWAPGGNQRSPLGCLPSVTIRAGQEMSEEIEIYRISLPNNDGIFKSGRGVLIDNAPSFIDYHVNEAIIRVQDASAPPSGITLSVEPGDAIAEDAAAVPLTLQARFNSPSQFSYDVVFPVEFSPEVIVTQRVGGVCTATPRDLEAQPVTVTIPKNVENPVGRSDSFCLRAPGDNVVTGNRTLTISADPVMAQPGLDISEYPVSPAMLTITDVDVQPTAITLRVEPNAIPEAGGGPSDVMLSVTFDGTSALTGPTDFPVVFPNHEAAKVTVARKADGAACPSEAPATSAASVTVTIEARVLTGTAPLCVWPEDDSVFDEGGRTLEIDITDPGVTIRYTDGVTPATLTITEDESAPTRIVLDVQPGEIFEGQLGPHTIGGESGFSEFTLTASFESGSSLLPTSLSIPLDTALSHWTPDGSLDVPLGDIAGAFPVPTVTILAEEQRGAVQFHRRLVENDVFLPEMEERIFASSGYTGTYPVSPATLMLRFNNPQPTGVTLRVMSDTISESDGITEVILTATLGGSSTLPYAMEIPVSFSDLAAAGIEELGSRVGDSCVASPLTVTIPTGQGVSSAVPFCVKPRQDSVVTPNRTLTISAPDQPAPPGFSPYRVASATLTITEADMPPTGVAFSITPDRVNEGAVAETITVTATLTGGTGLFPDPVTLIAVVYPETAIEDADYTVRTSGASRGLVPIPIAAGVRTGSATFTISPTPDSIVEGPETVGVGFPDGRTGEITSSGVRYTLTGTSDLLTIVDDDVPPTEILITLDPGEAREGRGLQPVRVTAAFQDDGDSRLPEDLTVRLTLGGDTRDYSAFAEESEGACDETSVSTPVPSPGPTPFSIVIPRGERFGERYLCFTPVPDGVFAGDRRVPVSLDDPEGALADYTVTLQPDALIILDADTLPSRVLLLLDRTEIPEEGGEQSLTLTAQFPDGDGAALDAETVVLVPLTSSAGAADYGGYQVNPGAVRLTIPAGARSSAPAPFALTPADDIVVELEMIDLGGGGRATASLNWPAGDSAPPGRPDTLPVDGAGAMLRIIDDDVALVSLEGPTEAVDEGQDAEFTVRLSNPVAGPVGVSWFTSDGSAVAGVDYTGQQGSLGLSASPPDLAEQTLAIPVLRDGISENAEYFELILVGVTGDDFDGRVRVDGAGTAQATIAANGPITVVLEGPPQGVPEGEDAVFRVSLFPEGILPDAPITLDYATQDGTAEAGRDYTGVSDTLRFTEADAAPQEVRVPTLDNNLYDGAGERSFTLRLNNVTGGGSGRTVEVQAPLTEDGGFAAPARIVDDETPPELHLHVAPGEIAEAAVGAPGGRARLGVEVRGGAFAEARTIEFTFGGDATLDVDYRVSGTTIGVPAGALGRVPETLQIDVINDEVDDDDEWILVSARVLEEDIEVLGEARQVLIRDDDDPWVTVSFSEAFMEIPEGRSRRITALLDAPPERQVVIPLATELVGGATLEDYEDVPEGLVFGSEDTEQHFVLRVRRDRVEPEEGEGIRISIVEAALPERVLLGEPPGIAVSFVELPFGEDVQHALKYALASFGRSVALSTLDVIEDRFEVTDDTLGVSYIAVGGRRVPLGAMRRGPRERSARRSSKPTLRDVTDMLGVRFPRRSDEPGSSLFAPGGGSDGGGGSGASLSAPGSWSGGGGGYTGGSGLGPFASFAPGSWSGSGGASSSVSGGWSDGGGGGYDSGPGSFSATSPGGHTGDGGSSSANFTGASPASTSSSARNRVSRNTGSRDIGRGGGEPDMRVRIDPPSARSLLSRSEFRLAPGATGTVAVDSAWTVWGRSDVRSFDGNPGGRFDLDATTYSTHIGVDYRRSESLLTGFSLSHTIGDMSYVDASRDDTRGDFQAHLTAVNHYSHWSYSDTLDLYVVMGEGFGVAEIKEYGKRAKTDINLSSSILGARHALPPAGVVAMAAKADAFLVEVESDARPAIGLPKLTAQVMRMRAMLEGSVKSTTKGGARLRNTFEMGVLLDAGDADRGEGLEFGTEFHYADDISGVELSGRWLLAYASGGYQEWGAAVTLNLDPGAPGRGVRLSLAPDWGAPSGGGVDALWRGALERGATEDGGGRGAGRAHRGASPEQVKMEVAYGMGIQGGAGGRVEPFGTWFFEDSGAWNLRLGVRLELSRFARSETGEGSWLPNNLQMEFFNERHTALYREDDHRIGIKFNAAF